ncbi:MAG: hypothetical protein M1835_002349 [Candelina submexicana]|nr:MAG: hypothetical protein M1835_002349 [Candelina submexicana]
MLLDRNDNIKFCDFAGSSIDGEKSSCYYESRATYPFPRGSPEWEAELTTVGTEIFALGTALFEISTTRPPYHEIENGTRKIEELYVARQFASVEGLLMGSIINKCWNDGYGEVKEVLIDLRGLEQEGYASSDPQEVTANGTHMSKKAFSDEKVVVGTAGCALDQNRHTPMRAAEGLAHTGRGPARETEPRTTSGLNVLFAQWRSTDRPCVCGFAHNV